MPFSMLLKMNTASPTRHPRLNRKAGFRNGEVLGGWWSSPSRIGFSLFKMRCDGLWNKLAHIPLTDNNLTHNRGADGR